MIRSGVISNDRSITFSEAPNFGRCRREEIDRTVMLGGERGGVLFRKRVIDIFAAVVVFCLDCRSGKCSVRIGCWVLLIAVAMEC